MISKRLLKSIWILPAILAMVGSLSLTGCVKDFEMDSHEPGTDIIFGVSNTGADNEETRTEYSGKNQTNADIYSNPTNTTYERIDWVTDKDRIRILCNQATGKANASTKTADYVIYNVSIKNSDNKRSQASITSCDNNSLQWGTSNPHYFYALYPAPGTVSNYSFSTYPSVTTTNSKIEKDADNANKAKITGVIPATQEVVKSGTIYKPNMNYAYMYAATRFNPASSGNVTLSFEPLVTTLEFILSDKSTDHITSKLTTLELTASTTLTGTFTAPIDVTSGSPSVGTPTLNNTGKKITITLPDGGIVLSSSSKIHVTFLTLPVDQKDLTLTLTFANNSKRTIQLKHLNSNQITARKKAYFDLTVQGTIPYTLNVQGPSTVAWNGGNATYKVQSYKQGNSGNVAVGWTVDAYSTNNGSTWSSSKPSWLSLTTQGDGSTGYTNFTATLQENTDYQAKTWGGSTTVVGEEYKPRNLATYTIDGSSTGKLNTANCYVVSAPGWYCIPMIYGNGYKGDANNTGSYKSSTGLTQFANHSGTIGGAWDNTWIQNNDPMREANMIYDYTNVQVVLLWQDRNGLIDANKFDTFNEYIEQSQVQAYNHNWNYWNGGAVRGRSYGGRYIRFYVDPNHIGQGNAVIGLKYNGTIIWSWHIWVIEQSKVATKSVNGTTMMVSNLGWVDPDEIPLARSVKVRLKQTGSTNTAIFTINQEKKPTQLGSNVFYQWGRKDPMLGWKAIQDPPVTRDQWGSTQYGVASGQATLADAIKNPNKFYGGQYHWVVDAQNQHNLWNTGSGGADSNSAVTKTVYDPCPPGYKVPNRNVYSGFSASSIVGSFEAGWSVKTSSSGSDTMFLPATFIREYDGGIAAYRLNGGLVGGSVMTDPYVGGYIWTAAWATFFEYRRNGHYYGNYGVPDSNSTTEFKPIVKDVTGYGMSVRCVTE